MHPGGNPKSQDLTYRSVCCWDLSSLSVFELFRVGHNVTKHIIMFHDLTGNRSEGDGSVVQGKWLVSFFEDGMYVHFFPVLWDIPYLLQELENFPCPAFFNTQQGISSRPAAFLKSRLLNSFAILSNFNGVKMQLKNVEEGLWEVVGSRDPLEYTMMHSLPYSIFLHGRDTNIVLFHWLDKGPETPTQGGKVRICCGLQ